MLIGKSKEFGNISLFDHSVSVLNYGMYILNNYILIDNFDNPKEFLYHFIISLAFHDVGKCDKHIQDSLKKGKSIKYTHNDLSYAYLSGSDGLYKKPFLSSVFYHHVFEQDNNEDTGTDHLYRLIEESSENYNLFTEEMNEYLSRRFDFYKEIKFTGNDFNDDLSNIPLDGNTHNDKNVNRNEIEEIKAETTIIRAILINADRTVSKDFLNNEEYLNGNVEYMKSIYEKTVKLSEDISGLNLYELKDENGEIIYNDKERLDVQNKDFSDLKEMKCRPVILSASAGYGKTLMGIRWIAENKTKSYWVVPRNVIAEGTYKSIISELSNMKSKITVGLLLTGEFVHGDEYSDIIVTNIDNFLSYSIKNLMTTDLAKLLSVNVVFDEYHEFLCNAPLYSGFIDFVNIRSRFSAGNTLLMSATPLSFGGVLRYYNEKQDESEYIRNKFQAHSFNGEMNVKIKYINFSKNIDSINKYVKDDSFVICDTVRNSQILFENNMENNILIHSYFPKNRRTEIENKIYELHGKHSDVSKRNIIYGTNIIGVGLDISAKHIYDMVITPEDTIQRCCGRGGRFNENEYNSEIEYYICDVQSNMRNKLYTNSLSEKWIDVIKKYDGQTITKNKLYDLYNNFHIENKDEIKKEYKKLYDISYNELKKLKPYHIFSKKKQKNKKLSTGETFRGKSYSVYVCVKSKENDELSENIVIDQNMIMENEFEKTINKERFYRISEIDKMSTKERNYYKKRLDRDFFMWKATNYSTPFILYYSEYDDNIGLKLNGEEDFD